jgi:hypothetical protein
MIGSTSGFLEQPVSQRYIPVRNIARTKGILIISPLDCAFFASVRCPTMSRSRQGARIQHVRVFTSNFVGPDTSFCMSCPNALPWFHNVCFSPGRSSRSAKSTTSCWTGIATVTLTGGGGAGEFRFLTAAEERDDRRDAYANPTPAGDKSRCLTLAHPRSHAEPNAVITIEAHLGSTSVLARTLLNRVAFWLLVPRKA